jgi:hypothetical protein
MCSEGEKRGSEGGKRVQIPAFHGQMMNENILLYFSQSFFQKAVDFPLWGKG